MASSHFISSSLRALFALLSLSAHSSAASASTSSTELDPQEGCSALLKVEPHSGAEMGALLIFPQLGAAELDPHSGADEDDFIKLVEVTELDPQLGFTRFSIGGLYSSTGSLTAAAGISSGSSSESTLSSSSSSSNSSLVIKRVE